MNAMVAIGTIVWWAIMLAPFRYPAIRQITN
jgi:hypothetical protein